MKPSQQIQKLARDDHHTLMDGYRQCDPATTPAIAQYLDNELPRILLVQRVLIVLELALAVYVALKV